MNSDVQERKFRRRFVLGLILLVLLFILAVLDGSRRIQSDLRQKAQIALREAGYDSSLLRVNGRDATLSGVTPSDDAKMMMVNLVDDIRGVRVVRDALTVDASAFETSRLAVDVRDNGVYLAGTVSKEARDEILSVAEITYGNGNVESDLVVADVQDNLPDISQILSQLSSVGARSFELTEDTLTLSGAVASEAEQLQLESVVRDAVGSDLSIANALAVDETLNAGATSTVEGTVAPEVVTNEVIEETDEAGTTEASTDASAAANGADAEPSMETELEPSNETANTEGDAEPTTAAQDAASEAAIPDTTASEASAASVAETGVAEENESGNTISTNENAVVASEALSEPDISITYGSGTVQLAGTVASEEVRQAAQAAFPNKTVTNGLKLDDGVRASEWLPNLLDMSARIEGNVLNPSLEVSGDSLTIRGTVASEAMSSAVEGYLVDAVSPTLSVDNQLEIQDLIPFSEEGK